MMMVIKFKSKSNLLNNKGLGASYKLLKTCYAKWLSICSGYYEFNALVHVHCVEWNCHYFFHLSFVPVLHVLPPGE